ncbi:helix-turn-helix domain-containing protein [Flagellimonas aequoris]|uniref:AraC family transcriptional regulator n=1 Tax=Flagellimonas aequoris TaxID=2306997 RepID=A0A418N2R2_9FLAO|nr:AraC family transcriptional regulator [Allomuricauda aequoris]RIV67562.1 AraC family transcriptional regulator [Allomuricauda aequoris]TXJ99387.1 helix-turn-helix transcriptional regulator [Allomuricauda aequoris]
MTFYRSEILRIKDVCYSNTGQIQKVLKTRNYIENHLDQDLNLDTLAYVGFTSKYHLLRLFKQYYGQTPMQFLIDKRIEKSKFYLKKGISISETCYLVGFESPSSFSTLFKKKTGSMPSSFQKKQFSQSRSIGDF